MFSEKKTMPRPLEVAEDWDKEIEIEEIAHQATEPSDVEGRNDVDIHQRSWTTRN
jgi:hypothetical protein